MVKKVAIIGSSNTQTTIANFVLALDTGLKRKVSWFSKKDEAETWLVK